MTDTQDQPSQDLSSQALPPKANTPKNVAHKRAKVKHKKPLNIWPFALLVILIFALSAVAAVYFWQQLEKQTILIQSLATQNESRQNSQTKREKSLHERIKGLDTLIKAQNLTTIKLTQQSQFNTQQLHDLGARNRADWLLAEAEYLMHLANQRLTLEQDVRSAEAILVSADHVLAENDDPGLLTVRQALADEILALQQTKTADVEGLYVRLSAMIKSLERLDASVFLSEKDTLTDQMTTPVSTSENTEFSWQGLWNEIWSDLKKIVTIQRLDHKIEPLLAPEQSYYLKQNLRLMFEQASLSILNSNQAIYQDSLEKASLWIKTYFDPRDTATQALLEQLKEIQTAQINPTLPDISASLRLLKNKIESMYLNHSLGKLSRPNQALSGQENEPTNKHRITGNKAFVAGPKQNNEAIK